MTRTNRSVFVRVDSSVNIGSGHVVRCLTLAEQLRRDGADVRFVSAERDGSLIPLIERAGFEVSRLPKASVTGDGYTEIDEALDARLTAAEIARLGVRPDWLVVDHYGLGEKWEIGLRPHIGKILVIDDLADRRHDCDALLDQNLVADFEVRYADKTPPHSALLLGPTFVLMQDQYRQLPRRLVVEQQVKRLVIYFGAADVHDLTGMTLAALMTIEREDLQVDVVLGSSYARAEHLQRLVAGRPGIHIHQNLPSLAELMSKADLAVGATGATSWERLYFRVPAIVTTLADNQRPLAAELSRRGLVDWLGDADEINVERMRSALAAALATDRFPAIRATDIVDGLGALRVSSYMLLDTATPLDARPVVPDDDVLLLDWANDPATRANAFSADTISPDVHRRWLASRLADPSGHRLLVVVTGHGLPIGQVRFDREGGNAWVISYSIDRLFRGRGLGNRALGVAIDRFASDTNAETLLGRVKRDNTPSMRVFESLGFTSSPLDDRSVEFRRKL